MAVLPKGSDSDILDRFEPEWLDQHGYINLEPSLLRAIDKNRNYYIDSTHRRSGKWYKPLPRGLPHTTQSLSGRGGIHAVFRETNWPGISAADYSVLTPVLHLASRLLEEPAMLLYFAGILSQDTMPLLRDPHAKKSTKLKSHQSMSMFHKKFVAGPVPPPEPPGPARPLRTRRPARPAPRAPPAHGPFPQNASQQQRDLWRKIRKLRDCVRFRIGGAEVEEPIYAVTKVDFDMPGLTNDSCGCLIRIQRRFFDVLHDIHTADMVAQEYIPWNPGNDADSGKVRTRFYMAMVLVHELCHAMYICGHSKQALVRSGKRYVEPFYGDQRIAELGTAWESTVFRGTIQSAGAENDPAFPYGVARYDWPGLNRAGYAPGPNPRVRRDGDGERRSPARYGVKWGSQYLIKSKWIQGFFTRRFWDVEVERYGLSAFRPPKKSGVRLSRTDGPDPDEPRALPVRYLSPVSDPSDVDETDARDMDGIIDSESDDDDDDDD